MLCNRDIIGTRCKVAATMDRDTSHNLNKEQIHRLCIRADENDCCMEQQGDDIILKAPTEEDAAPDRGLGTAIHELFKPFGGVELEIPPREPMIVTEFSTPPRSH